MANENERTQIFVDINDTNLLEGEIVDIDFSADFQAKAAPPPKKRYKLKLVDPASGKLEMVKRDGEKRGDKAGTPFYIKHFEGRIVSEDEWNNTVIFCKASSYIGRGKKINAQAGLMKMGGVAKLPTGLTDLQWTKLFEKFLAKEVMLWADCDWSAYEQKDNGEWKALALTMLKFPKNQDGTYNNIIKDSKGGEVQAKIRVVEWLGRGQVASTSTPASAPVVSQPKLKPTAAPKPAPKPIAVVEETMMVDEDVPTNNDGDIIFDE